MIFNLSGKEPQQLRGAQRACRITNRSSAAVMDKVPELIVCARRAQLNRYAA
jgi:hypothetical protein